MNCINAYRKFLNRGKFLNAVISGVQSFEYQSLKNHRRTSESEIQIEIGGTNLKVFIWHCHK